MKIKYRLQGLLAGLIISVLIIGAPVLAEEVLNVVANPFPILVDGVQDDSISALNVNGYTFLKLRDIGKIGVTVKFNETDNIIEITSPSLGLGDEKVSEEIINPVVEEGTGTLTDGGSTSGSGTSSSESNGDPDNIVLPPDDDGGTIYGDEQPK